PVANALETSTPVPEPTARAAIFSEATASMANPTSVVPLSRPVSAGAVSVSPDGRLVVAVNPDSDSITLVDAITLAVLAEIPVGDNPRTLSITPDSKMVLVANHGSATLSKVDLSQALEVKQYPVGSMPYGVVTDGIRAFVAEFGLGTLSMIDLATGELLTRIPVDAFPAGLALSRDRQRLFVTHFFTGRLTVIDQQTSTIHGMASTGTDTNLSQFIAITPDGTKAYLPQTRSNITNTDLLFDTTVFPVVNVVDLAKLQLLVGERITLDTADEPVNMPFAVALSPDGKTLYLANAGSDDVSVIDLSTNRGLAHLTVGANPRGIAITPDGSRIFVNNVLDGTLSVIDGETFSVTDTVLMTDISMTPPLLLGKKLFNSAAEPALTTDNWISCATCHFDGMMDARTWLGFPDGPRNTPGLFRVAQTLPLHWSGDFDELGDVEITIRKIQFGNGLVAGESHDSLGPPHSGLSPQLDALVAYIASIQGPLSPYRGARESTDRGRSLFRTLDCQICHTPPLYTDLKLHDVGTGDLTKENNSHGRGTKFDTPALHGLWLTAPYFHDGSAATLQQVLRTGTTHNIVDRIDGSDLEDLITFILALPDDNDEPH
ncbi:MAG: beta-propeller fold lactonase family protein, partial [Chloroflexota bacterium]|nr:beta-propeller fold lactonase family protein [Chloroflexota bacterium]